MITADRLQEYSRLMRLDKPIGVFLLLWPTLWALWIAGKGTPDLKVFLVFVLGVFLMRSAGCVINDLADKDIDGQVARTRHRPLAAGTVEPEEALRLFMVLLTSSFLLVCLMNAMTIMLAFIGGILAATYPFSKRYTHLPQVHLGLAFGWAVPMVFAAQNNQVSKVAWMLFLATVLWAVIYDTMYAMVDRPEDIRIGVKSTAILFGEYDRQILGMLQVAMFYVLIRVGKEIQLGEIYYFGLLIAAGFAVYHQYLIRNRDPAGCFQAFLNNNWLGASVFLGIMGHYMAH